MITKKFGVEFGRFDSMAITLTPEDVGVTEQYGEFECTHADGWTISGVVHSDYYFWVNSFKASHPIFGKVWGDFEEEVFADSEEGYAHFLKHHPYQVWDYYDI